MVHLVLLRRAATGEELLPHGPAVRMEANTAQTAREVAAEHGRRWVNRDPHLHEYEIVEE